MQQEDVYASLVVLKSYLHDSSDDKTKLSEQLQMVKDVLNVMQDEKFMRLCEIKRSSKYDVC